MVHFTLVDLVVIAEQMQQSVQTQDLELIEQRTACLLPGDFRTNHHVSQIVSASRGEGKDVGSIIPVAVFFVQLSHTPLTHQRHRENNRIAIPQQPPCELFQKMLKSAEGNGGLSLPIKYVELRAACFLQLVDLF